MTWLINIICVTIVISGYSSTQRKLIQPMILAHLDVSIYYYKLSYPPKKWVMSSLKGNLGMKECTNTKICLISVRTW